MRFSNLAPTRAGICVVLGCLAARSSAYFLITNPTQTTAWKNDAANLVTWTKGVLDGIDSFDVELSQLSSDGLTYVAQNVPATSHSLNIYVQDLIPGDDYFLLFINSTHGVMYATSPRFTILGNTTAPANFSSPSPDSSAPTVTVSGTPSPMQAFATTFPAVANGVTGRWSPESHGSVWGLCGVMLGSILGAAWTLW